MSKIFIYPLLKVEINLLLFLFKLEVFDKNLAVTAVFF